METYPRIIENNKVVYNPFKEPTNSDSGKGIKKENKVENLASKEQFFHLFLH